MSFDTQDYINVFINKNVNNIEIQKKKLNSCKNLLYKYYPLPNEFTINNLNKEIIHYSRPNTFNDPFDCFLGYDENEFAEEILLALVFDPYNQIPSEQYDLFYKIILNKPLTNNEFVLFEKYVKTRSIDKKINFNMQNFLSKEYAIRANALINLLTDNNSSDSGAINEILKAYSHNKLHLTVKESINQVYGISCFCESFDNALMWSHYANKHAGICIEYDFSKLPLNHIFLTTLFPVIYTNKRQHLPTGVSYDEFGKLKINKLKLTTFQIITSLITKSDIWCSENEWRSINWLSELDKNQNLILNIISKVYLGVNISQEHKHLIIEICNRKNIPYIEMKLSKSEYSLIAK